MKLSTIIRNLVLTGTFFIIYKKIQTWLLKRSIAKTITIRNYINNNKDDFPKTLAAFKQLILDGYEKGSQLTCIVNGKIVIDVCGGRDEQSVFEKHQMTMLFSSTKVFESLIVAMLADRNLIAYDAPVKKYLPGFYSDTITISDLMRYRAGCAAIHKTLTLKEAQEIFNDPIKTEEFALNHLSRNGVRLGISEYHSFTRGLLVAAILYRVTGKTMEQFVQEEIVLPVRRKKQCEDIELHIGCPQNKQSRMAIVEPSGNMLSLLSETILHVSGFVDLFLRPSTKDDVVAQEEFHRDWMYRYEAEMMKQILKYPPTHHRKSLVLVHDVGLGTHYLSNSPEFRALPLSSANGASNSFSLANILSEIQTGTLLSPTGLQRALETDGTTFDEMLGVPLTYTANGWGCDRFPGGFIGWAGAGGSLTLFHPKHNAAFSYIPTRLESRTHKPNGLYLLRAFMKDLVGIE
jgi:hypothetical protein